MINSADLQNYRNGEFIQFMLTVKNKCTELDPAALQLEAQVTDLANHVQSIDNLYKPFTGSDITPELVVLDARRDNAIIGIRSLAESFTSHFDAPKKMAGEEILANIEHYGSKIYLKNYVEETTIIRSIVSDFENIPKLQNSVSLLQIGDWVQEMKDANTQFQEKYEARINENSGQETSLDLQRVETTTSYRTLVSFINSYEVISPSENLTLLIDRINQTILQYNQIVANRIANGEGEAEKKEGGTTPENP